MRKRKKEEEPKVPEKVEFEVDDKEDSRPRVDTEVVLNEYDSSLNADISNGNICHALTADAFGHLIAGVRSNVGMKSGRYYFEVKLLETINNHHRQARNVPSTMVLVGLTTMDGDALLNQSHSVAFTQDGDFLNGTEKMRGQSKKVSLTSTVGILVNLIEGHENFNTISMFRDGLRASPPMKLPEQMQGKALFPTVNYKNASLTVNLGDTPIWKPLMTGEKDDLKPLKVTQIGAAAKEDTELSANIRKAGETYEVVVPVGLPDQGAYDWLDNFNKDNKYTEISNRHLMEWAKVTGHSVTSSRTSFLDAPEMGLSVAGLDDFTCMSTLRTLAARKRRNYVIMNVRDNLLKSRRTKVLNDFSSNGYKVIADVIIGQPTADFIALQKERETVYQTQRMRVQADVEDKRNQREHKQKVRDQEDAKKKRRAELEKERAEKKPEEEKKAEADVEMKEGEEAEKKEGEEATEEKKEEETTEEKKDESTEEKSIDDILAEEFPAIPEPEPAVPKPVEFKDDFKFRTNLTTSDMKIRELERAFEDFTLPTTEEGFAEVKYLWSNEADAHSVFNRYIYLKKIIIVHKFDQDEDSKAMINKWGDQRMEWRKYYRDWQDKLKKANDWREEQKKKEEAGEAGEKKEGEQEEKKEEEKPAEEAEKKEGEESEKKEGEQEGEKKEEEKPVEIDYSKMVDLDNEDFAAKFDAFTTQDICNIDGNGMPLFAKFQQEDWTLAGLRYELHCLLAVFKKLVPADVRPGIHKSLFCEYFHMVFRRDFVPTHYGSENMDAFFSMMEDTMKIDADGLLFSENDDETAMSVFIRLTEDARRIRQAKIDSGDETAKLVFKMTTRSDTRGKGKGKGKGKGRGSDRRDEPRRDDRRSSYGKGGGRDSYKSSGGGYGGSSYGKGSSRPVQSSGYGGSSYGASNYGGSSRGGGNSYGSYPMGGSGQKRGGEFQDDYASKRRNYGQSGYQARR